MGARQEFFKEELAGSVQKRIFKAELKGEPIVVSPRLKLIVPLVKFSSVHDLLIKMHDFEQFEWAHKRGRNGTLEYAGYPVAEHITQSSFYLWDDWQVYHRHRHLLTHMGWIEMNGRHEIQGTFNYFIPLGMYDKKDFIEVERRDGSIDEFPLPEYDEGAKRDNGFLVNTMNARRISYCSFLDGNELWKQDIPNMVGVPVEKLALQGNCINFPTAQA